jgi:hypothetical protein
MEHEVSWLQLVAAPVTAVIVPLVLHRIFFHKKTRHSSSTGSGSLEEYMSQVQKGMPTDANALDTLLCLLALLIMRLRGGYNEIAWDE